jgi:predicted amidohydrolase YtcJ
LPQQAPRTPKFTHSGILTAPPPLAKTIISLALLGLAAFLWAPLARGQPADIVLVNGKVITLDAKSSIANALAIRGGNIMAVGTSDAIRKLAGSKTQVVDLDGKTVILGLIDSHVHAIRAALTFGIETDWSAIRSLDEGLKIISTAARAKPGAWIIVGGGWHEDQVKEHRGPTSAELAMAAPDNPVYVQHLYDYAVVSPKAITALGIESDAQVPRRAQADQCCVSRILPTVESHGSLAWRQRRMAMPLAG